MDSRSAAEGALPFGQKVVFALAQGATALWAEGCGIALRAMNIYAAKGGSKNRITGPTAR